MTSKTDRYEQSCCPSWRESSNSKFEREVFRSPLCPILGVALGRGQSLKVTKKYLAEIHMDVLAEENEGCTRSGRSFKAMGSPGS